MFEIIEVVPDLDSDMKRSFKLRLRCRDEAKGPVTAVCGIDGYLVSSMGQKVRNVSNINVLISRLFYRFLCVRLTLMSVWSALRSSTSAYM